MELSTKRRDGYLAAISRDDLTVDMLEKSDYRVCSEHFVDGSLQSFMNLPNRTGSLPLILGIQNRETIQVMQGMIELNEEMMSKE